MRIRIWVNPEGAWEATIRVDRAAVRKTDRDDDRWPRRRISPDQL